MADKKPPIFKDPVKLNIPTADEVNKGALVPKKGSGLKSLLRKSHPLLRAIDTISILKEVAPLINLYNPSTMTKLPQSMEMLTDDASSYTSDTLAPSEKKFKGITERIAKENMDLVNKVLEIILPDQSHGGEGPLTDDTGLRQFAKEQIKKAPNPKGLRTVVDKRGLPRLVYHATSSPEPFEEFHTDSRFKDDKGNQFATTKGFLSTGTDREQMQRWHPTPYPISLEATEEKLSKGEQVFEEGARTIPGMVRAKNVFDHNNPEHIEMLRNNLIEEEVERLEKWLKPEGPMAVTMEELKEAYRYPDGTIKTSKEQLEEQLEHNKMMQKLMSDKARERIEHMKNPNFLYDIKHGHWMEIEDKRRYLKELGFDAFTTRES